MLVRLVVLMMVVQGILHAGQPHVYCQKKWRELKWEGLKIQVLKLRAEEFPVGKSYTLFIRNCDGSETEVFNYTANKKGHLIIEMNEDLKKGAPFAVTPLRKGEKVSYCMFSEDRSEEYTASIIPFPIEATKSGASISVELIDAKAESFVCVGKGFNPGEEVQIQCQSGEQTSQATISADGEGAFKYLVWPSVNDVETGTAALTVKRQNEDLKVSFVWGKDAQEFIGAICLQIH